MVVVVSVVVPVTDVPVVAVPVMVVRVDIVEVVHESQSAGQFDRRSSTVSASSGTVESQRLRLTSHSGPSTRPLQSAVVVVVVEVVTVAVVPVVVVVLVEQAWQRTGHVSRNVLPVEGRTKR